MEENIMSRNFVPRNDRKFLVWLVYLLNNVMSLGLSNIPPEEIEAVRKKANAFEDALVIAENPDRRTQAAVRAKTDARKIAEKAAREFIREHLTYNKLVTDANRLSIGLPVHKTTHTRVPKPTQLVDFLLKQLSGSRVEAHFTPYNEAGEEKEKSEAKPYGVIAAGFLWAVLPEPPKSYDDLTHSSFVTRSPFTWQFDLKDAGRTLYVCACWLNTRGEKGPWSKIQSIIIA
jgi:hypothetical protein